MSGRNAYLEASVQTARPGRRLVMLYDGMMRFIHIAMNAIVAKDNETASNNLKYAQDIVLNLRESLDKNISPELFESLYPLYSFWYQKLIEANVKKSTDILEELLPLIEQLRDTWQQAELQLTQEKAEGNL